MALDLTQTVDQIDRLAHHQAASGDDRKQRLANALGRMVEVSPDELARKVEANRTRPFLCAGVRGGFAERIPAPRAPKDHLMASVDGSHVDVDRHLPVRCYLINIGGCLLTYGSEPDATLFSKPRLHFGDEDLYMTSPDSSVRDTVAVEGQILGLKRTVDEVSGLADLVEESTSNLPTLALVDGSLIMWGLAGRGHQPFVRDRIIVEGLLPALERMRRLAARPLAVAAYISLPQTTEVVNALRLSICPFELGSCMNTCSTHRSGTSPCNLVQGFLDRDLFQTLLRPGERSSVFYTCSSVSRDYYGDHEVNFFYLNTGDEIARIEVPAWVADDPALVDLTHGLLMDQCRRGFGYPVAIAEAHEQAVVTGADRHAFRRLVESALEGADLPVYTSEKALSKRVRSL